MTELNNNEKILYLRVYDYYRKLIESGQINPGEKLPSIRCCANQLEISRTTAETAYLQLAADGYVIARPQSGYYVTKLPTRIEEKKEMPMMPRQKEKVQYDFSAHSVDRESFDFKLWQRYIKSALRQDSRLLSYGEPQGELELRIELADYLRKARNISCKPWQIVIGAGTQSLLHILCPMILKKQSRREVSFPTDSMRQGITIFRDYGYEIHIKDKNAGVIYVSPSHMNRMGEVMAVKRRLELIGHAAENKGLIIEDDYESEFQEPGQPIPALYALAGGEGVVYLGTFSRMLLPSIRLSFMVLPLEFVKEYQKVGDNYNQTASKTEQIALCQFIRDGHMETRIRKLKRLYCKKTEDFYNKLAYVLGTSREVRLGNLCVMIQIKDHEAEKLKKSAVKEKICFDGIETDRNQKTWLILSSLSISQAALGEAVQAVKRLLL